MILTRTNSRLAPTRVLDSVFDTFLDGRVPMAPGAGAPAVDAWVSDETAHLVVDLPGYALEDLEINVHERTLTLSGTRVTGPGADDVELTIGERPGGSFRRAFSLPFESDADRVEATLENGVLRILAPRLEATATSRIEIKRG